MHTLTVQLQASVLFVELCDFSAMPCASLVLRPAEAKKAQTRFRAMCGLCASRLVEVYTICETKTQNQRSIGYPCMVVTLLVPAGMSCDGV
jgi:hypothetical protein